MLAGAREKKRDDERVEGSECCAVEDGGGEDERRCGVRHEDEADLGEQEKAEGEPVERGLSDEREERRHEEAAHQCREPVEKRDGGRRGGGAVADCEAGKPAAERVLVADVEKHGDGEESDGEGRAVGFVWVAVGRSRGLR